MKRTESKRTINVWVHNIKTAERHLMVSADQTDTLNQEENDIQVRFLSSSSFDQIPSALIPDAGESTFRIPDVCASHILSCHAHQSVRQGNILSSRTSKPDITLPELVVRLIDDFLVVQPFKSLILLLFS